MNLLLLGLAGVAFVISALIFRHARRIESDRLENIGAFSIAVVGVFVLYLGILYK